jgi:hypothetical protein
MAGINHASVAMSASDIQGRKRNVTIAGMDSSPGSVEDMDDDSRDDKRRQPVKRACNECRQQKVSNAWSRGMHSAGGNTSGPRPRSTLILIQPRCSFDAMLFRTLGLIVLGVVDSNWIARLSRTSSGSESVAAMRRWSERSSN